MLSWHNFKFLKLMCKRFLIGLMALMLGGANLHGQSFVKLYESKQPIVGWELDPLGQLYVFAGYDLIKLDSSGTSMQSFSSRDFGLISGLDVTNPFSPLLIYGSMGSLLELDQSFAIKSRLNPMSSGSVDQLFICRIQGQGFWMFNQVTGRPESLDIQVQKRTEGTPVSAVLSGNFEVRGMVASDDYLVLTVAGYGLLVFDRYGTFLRKIPGPDIQVCGFSGSDLYYLQGNQIVRFDFKKNMGIDFMEIAQDLFPAEIKISNGRIFMRKGDVVGRYIP